MSTAPDALAVQLRLLGQPQLVTAGVAHPLERKDAALLALLALEGATSRDRAAALLWPDVERARARANLRQRLHRLRRQAGTDLVAGSDALTLAPGTAHTLQGLEDRLDTDPGALDGELLGTLDYGDCRELADWVDAARDRWRRQRRDALSVLATRRLAQDRVVAALACVERLLHDEPAFEPAHRLLMQLHLRRGDRAAALAAFERCREALARGPGATPDAQTRALHLKALQGDTDMQATPPPGPASMLRPPRLVGRDAECRQLAQAWAERMVVVLTGEPGIGKTRLLTDFAATQPGCIVVAGRVGDADTAYALLARLGHALLGHVGAALPDWVEAQLALLLPGRGVTPAKSWSAMRLRQALVEVLARTTGDVQGVLVDDVQYCDEASLELLTSLCLDTDARAPAWLFAHRAGEAPPKWSAWAAAVNRARLHELQLGPLDRNGVQALVASLALDGIDATAAAATLLRQAGGNPMFLLETLRAAGGTAPEAWPAPPRVDELIRRRLARLSDAGLGLAHVAALAGQDFDADLASAVLGRHALDLAGPWRELEAAQVIARNAFAHDLIHECTLRSVPEERAIDWHARIAAWLERRDGEPSRIAWHWKAARCWAPAGHAFAAAAARLRSRVRRDEEARLLEEADACFEAAGEHEARSDALLHLFRSHWDRKHRAGIRAVAAKMGQVARSPTARMWAAFSRAMVATDERPDADAFALVVKAREAAQAHEQDTGNALPLAQTLVWEASTLAILNHVPDALAAAQRVEGLMDRLPADRWRGHVQFNLGFTFEACSRLAQAMAQFDQAERIFDSLDEPVHVSETRSMSTIALWHLGRLGEATRRLDAGRRMWAEVNGGRAEPSTADVYIARYWREAGRLAQALDMLVTTVDRAERIADANLQGWAASELANLYLWLGQPARAGRLLELARAAPKLSVRLDGLLAEVRLARALGQPVDGALHDARLLVPQCMRADRLGWQLDLELARTLAAGDAAALMQANFEAATATQAWSCAAPSHALWIDALTRAGDAAGAATQAQALARWLYDAAPTAERPPMGLYPAEFWLILQRAFDAAGDADAAREAARRGAAWVRDVALQGLPDEFRPSFLEANPVNRALLARADAAA